MRHIDLICRLLKSGSFWGTLVVLWLVVGAVSPIFLWEWLRSGSESSESNASTIRNIGLVVGGGIALLFAFWRSVVAERRSETEQRQAETAQQGLLNERYQKGLEMLGSEVLSVRLGGIYELQRLAEEHPAHYHIQVMHSLCAFVRHPSENKGLNTVQSDNSNHSLREDVQETLLAVSKCHRKQLDFENKSEFRLYMENANLSRANLASANLSRSVLTGANLSHSFLNYADLSGSDLNLAKMCHSDLSDAKLMSASMAQTVMAEVDLRGADLSEAHLVGVDLTNCRFMGSVLSKTLFNNVKLDHADFHAVDLTGVIFLNRLSLSKANLDHANLSCVRLQEANLNEASLFRADLSSVDLIGATLTDASLRWANLSGAHLLGAELTDAELTDANLSGARFSSDRWHPARGLTQDQLDEARSDPDNPPILNGILDANTSKPLVWRGKPLLGES